MSLASVHENNKSFSSKSFRSETEAWSNSEMAYIDLYIYIQN